MTYIVLFYTNTSILRKFKRFMEKNIRRQFQKLYLLKYALNYFLICVYILNLNKFKKFDKKKYFYFKNMLLLFPLFGITSLVENKTVQLYIQVTQLVNS